MSNRHSDYVTYSVACAVVWSLVVSAAAAVAPKETFRKILTVCSGWWLGWASATIARSVYPPPKRQLR